MNEAVVNNMSIINGLNKVDGLSLRLFKTADRGEWQ